MCLLARQLGVNRNTVVAAYDDLADEGWVRSHTGRGTFVTRPPADDRPAGRDRGRRVLAHRLLPRGRGAGDRRAADDVPPGLRTPGGISFAGSYPARELLPVEAFARAIRARARAARRRRAGLRADRRAPRAARVDRRAHALARLARRRRAGRSSPTAPSRRSSWSSARSSIAATRRSSRSRPTPAR